VARNRGSTIWSDLIKLPQMRAREFSAIDRIRELHEDELIEETLTDMPRFILERRPRVMFENGGGTLIRWLMFGRPPRAKQLELSPLSYYVLTERYVDGDAA
jgi:hypothetical protein